MCAVVNLKPKQLILQDCGRRTLKLTTNRHEASRGLSAIAELLVRYVACGREPVRGSANEIVDRDRSGILAIRTPLLSASSRERGIDETSIRTRESEVLWQRDVTEASNDASNRRRIVQTNDAAAASQRSILRTSIFQPPSSSVLLYCTYVVRAPRPRSNPCRCTLTD